MDQKDGRLDMEIVIERILQNCKDSMAKARTKVIVMRMKKK